MAADWWRALWRHEPGDLHRALARRRLGHHFKVGIIKAPFMALVIGIVACSEGSASQGKRRIARQQTTTSVVKSIFLVIVLDGLFAVFFASIGM